MSYSKISSCPHCGAPIYVPIIWHGVGTPPLTYTCNCVKRTNPLANSSMQNPGFLPQTPFKIPKVEELVDSQKALEELFKALEEVKKNNLDEVKKDPINSLYEAFEDNAMIKLSATNEDIIKKLNSLEKTMMLILKKLKE